MESNSKELREAAPWTVTQRIALGASSVGVGLMAITQPVLGAVNFTPITELLSSVTALIPSFMDLVVAIAPLIVTIAIISFVLVFLQKILNMIRF